MARKKVAEKESVEQTIVKPLIDSEPNGVDAAPKITKTMRTRKVKVEEEPVDESSVPTPKSKKRKLKVEEEEQQEAIELSSDSEVVEKKANKERKRKRKSQKVKEDELNSDGEVVGKKKRPRRKAKQQRATEAMPLASRTVGHKLYIGAHVSGAGGVQNSVANSVKIGGNAFALFLKSQRKWTNPPLAAEQCTSFHANCTSHSYDQSKHVLPHGSYLVNLAHTDKLRTEQAFESFVDDLKRCERLGIQLYNFHPGVANSTGGDRPAAIAHLASNINRAHKATSSVVTVLENMAASGNTLGSTFEDLRDIIALTNDKKRVGVCLDTCHTFAAGYDLRTPAAFKATMDQFEEVVGFKYLRALHMNDSKAPLASHRDLHANIGTGFLGLRSFHNIVNDSRFEGLPLILETPLDAKDENGVPLKDDKGKPKSDEGIWAREIKLLESLVGMDTESEEFLELERKLAKRGESERETMNEAMEKKRLKEEKKGSRSKKGKKKVETESEEEDSTLSEMESDGELNGDTQRIVG